jgi:hypothetical protein
MAAAGLFSSGNAKRSWGKPLTLQRTHAAIKATSLRLRHQAARLQPPILRLEMSSPWLLGRRPGPDFKRFNWRSDYFPRSYAVMTAQPLNSARGSLFVRFIAGAFCAVPRRCALALPQPRTFG